MIEDCKRKGLKTLSCDECGELFGTFAKGFYKIMYREAQEIGWFIGLSTGITVHLCNICRVKDVHKKYKHKKRKK